MEQRSSLYTAVFGSNRFTLNPPAILNQLAVFEAGTLTPLQGEENIAAPPTLGQQSIFVQSVRIWSNYADGLVFTDSISPNGWTTPKIALYKSDAIPVNPLGINQQFISVQLSNLNEWVPVNKPLPGIAGPASAPIFAIISGAWQFETISIDPAYTGKNVLFGIQAMLSISNL